MLDCGHISDNFFRKGYTHLHISIVFIDNYESLMG